MSAAAVKAKTGRTWNQWVRVLNSAGMSQRAHREIAEYVHKEFDVSGWWAQTVTVGYERIHGLRAIGQRRDGSYEANKSKTFNVPIEKLYRAFSTKRLRDRWLDEPTLTIRKTTPHKSVRMAWPDGTAVEAYFTDKGKTKSQVAIQHRKLPSKSAATQRKDYWDKRLKTLAELIVGN